VSGTSISLKDTTSCASWQLTLVSYHNNIHDVTYLELFSHTAWQGGLKWTFVYRALLLIMTIHTKAVLVFGLGEVSGIGFGCIDIVVFVYCFLTSLHFAVIW
jgi:hypothetical protein